ncbi:dihydropteroate synthase [Candidatus Odyssella thessalonicensis]|uniref:dihydropteroate synthase n=1 Tax=Candidatus Odyssella thessalonicensis TaxID=84647 RepID=UPI000225C066|nr:dihydropteroate synthase [Candidatus Odyssella thessalonicensis]
MAKIENLESFSLSLLSGPTRVMGIINITPDSFSGDGLMQHADVIERAVAQAETFIGQGADILDIGGESTRPGAVAVALEEELSRVVPAVAAIHQKFPDILISIDTTKAEVARAAIAAGAAIINDVSGLLMDPAMVSVALEANVPVIIMHSQAAESVCQFDALDPLNRSGRSIDVEVASDLDRMAIHAISHGLTRHHIILDPGIGFAKTPEQNLLLISQLDRIRSLGYPVLLGVSRKSFIGYATGDPVEKRMAGSIAAATIGVMKGAQIVRVHDVAETVHAMKVVDAIRMAS